MINYILDKISNEISKLGLRKFRKLLFNIMIIAFIIILITLYFDTHDKFTLRWWICSVFEVIPFGLLVSSFIVRWQNYIDCPNCGEKVLIKENWQCDHCGEYQGFPRHIDLPCVKCHRLLTKAVCEHCEKGFDL